jgi:hypothetical protein
MNNHDNDRRGQELSLPHGPRHTRREEAISEFLPGSLDRTLGTEGAPRRQRSTDQTNTSGNRA